MTTFNDHDIIESIILKNMEAGLEQIIIDNWSSDGTWTIIEELRKKYPKKITAFHYPFEGPTSNFMWRAMLDLKTNIALHHKGRWIIHQDSDEYTIPPIKGIQLGDFLSFVEQEGFNCVSLRMLDFVPLNDDFTIGNPISHFKNYRISDIPSYIIQNKIWLQGDDKVDLVSSGGHNVFFKGRKIFPLRLPRFHYSIRSIEHAKSKYSPKRAERVKEEQEVLGWHGHTDFKIKEKVIYKEDETIRYHFDDLYTKKIKLFKF
ncbi:hypothetical protein CTN07_14785 [Photobacterium damselae]|nr:hypothetical protein CTN07_14785 [Photobacterium damselae]